MPLPEAPAPVLKEMVLGDTDKFVSKYNHNQQKTTNWFGQIVAMVRYLYDTQTAFAAGDAASLVTERLALAILPSNDFSNKGRGCTADKVGTVALVTGDWEVAAEFIAYNGSTFTNGGLCVSNSSSIGGSGVAMPAAITALARHLHPNHQYMRWQGSWLATKFTAGVNTVSPQSHEGVTRYRCIYAPSIAPTCVFQSRGIRVYVESGSITFYGHKNTVSGEEKIQTVSAGETAWCFRFFDGYDAYNYLFARWHATPGAVAYLAHGYATAGKVDLSGLAGGVFT